MHPLPLVVFLTLAAGPDRTVPTGCREDYETCREDCTIDYGGSTAKYRQLNQCMERCMHEQSECTSRHYSLRDAQIDPLPPRQADPAMREPERYETETRKPASSTHDGVRRGVYRASDSEPAAQAEPAEAKEPEAEPEPAPAPKPQPAAKAKSAPEPAAKSKDEEIRVFDDPEPEAEAAPPPTPKPAPKPSEPLRPKPPPEPKKKDIADWDPNGD
ncbi:hypothetical protein [Vitiosangium sp. GDMCC 1.1324]|uniref:hypothetical protein n=1 Tax=Vitiosangium sp. (strain GDMCC 1.1324) TaxID=2138576 RepID=UPI000D38DA1F|nr:hypothetical protein [Vitiosangium sp. GDMCC 1.1324]PTL83833.1 hypothetical protein DAT35_10220 [Vitiosangium sp. GDMCC 1.1324]